MLDLSWFDLNLQPSSAKNKWKRRPVVLTKFCSSWYSDEYDELNVKSRNYYFSIFIYWKQRVQFGAYKSKKTFKWFQGTISGFNEHGQNSWDLLWNAPLNGPKVHIHAPTYCTRLKRDFIQFSSNFFCCEGIEIVLQNVIISMYVQDGPTLGLERKIHDLFSNNTPILHFAVIIMNRVLSRLIWKSNQSAKFSIQVKKMTLKRYLIYIIY